MELIYLKKEKNRKIIKEKEIDNLAIYLQSNILVGHFLTNKFGLKLWVVGSFSMGS